MKRFAIVIPTMIIVAILATWILARDYSEVPLQIRILITAVGAMLSGLLSFILSKQDANRVNSNQIEK